MERGFLKWKPQIPLWMATQKRLSLVRFPDRLKGASVSVTQWMMLIKPNPLNYIKQKIKRARGSFLIRQPIHF
jgi:hypothetical protein